MRRWFMGVALGLTATSGTLWIGSACSNDYRASAEDGGGEAAAEAAADGSAVDAAADVDADAPSCPVRFMPPEGTYAYSYFVAGDTLEIGDAQADTQPFDQPFFATVKHEGAACFRLTAKLANGPKGSHVHSWAFCNACERDAGSLDLVDETDDFHVQSLGVTQKTIYTCARPNPYVVTDIPVDASAAQGACTGSSTGAESHTIQVVPVAYIYEGVVPVQYAAEDASVETYGFRRLSKTIVSGGDPAAIDTSYLRFDVDSGILANVALVATTSSTFGGTKVTYRFGVVAALTTSTVSP